MKESAKWRSGRARERTVGTRPGGRGGKSAEALGDDEGVATEHDRDVVMPTCKGRPSNDRARVRPPGTSIQITFGFSIAP